MKRGSNIDDLAERRRTRASTAAPTVQAVNQITDLGNAARFARQHGQDFRYCATAGYGGWLAWDGRRWTPDTTLERMRRARQSVFTELEAAMAEPDDGRRAARLKWAVRSQDAARLHACVTLAASEPGMALASLTDFDADPWLLNADNGTLDLRTGVLRETRRTDLLTKLAPVTYDPAAECSLWLAFLDRIFAGNVELIDFVQRFLGYALTGITRERVFAILWGASGRNGKTTLLETFRAILGDYALRTPAETLLVKRDGAIPNDVAKLRGARFVTASETKQGRQLDEPLVKDLTGGDTISARFMRAEWFEFRPSAKIFLGTNHKPEIPGTDPAIWDRVVLIPFTVRIPDEEQDQQLGAKLQAEAPGILAWAVRGCRAWQDGGLQVPEIVRAATKVYRAEEDALGVFLDERCTLGPRLTVAKGIFRTTYETWAKETRETALSDKELRRALAARGLTEGRTGAMRFWRGVALNGLSLGNATGTDVPA
jgi:putative DNA primase/helicase